RWIRRRWRIPGRQVVGLGRIVWAIAKSTCYGHDTEGRIMAGKIDKDVLIKHHFWILTGTFFLFALIPLLVLGTSVSATVSKEKTALASEEKRIRDVNNPKNDKWVDAYKKQEVQVDGKKREVWGQAWQTQKDLMTFPERMSATFKNPYFGDEIEP